MDVDVEAGEEVVVVVVDGGEVVEVVVVDVVVVVVVVVDVVDVVVVVDDDVVVVDDDVVDDVVVVSSPGVVGVAVGGGPAGACGGADTGWPSDTKMASPRFTRLGKYSAMCIGMRTQPCDAGYVGTDSEPCTATPLLVKDTGL